MPNPILPFSSRPASSIPSGVGIPRAQNFQVSKLNQKVEREAATVSINQAVARKAGAENMRSTSIAHLGGSPSAPSTSITHPGNSPSSGSLSDSGADDRRYAYMRKMIRERKAEEAAGAKKAGIDIGKGTAFRKTGVGGIHRVLSREFRAKRTQYGTLTSKEKEVLEKSITNRLSNKTTTSAISRYDKKYMKKDISKAHGAGDVSMRHAKILKKFIDKIH